MAAKGKDKNKDSESVLESSEVLQEKVVSGTEEFVQKNKVLVLAIIGILVIGSAAFIGWKYYIANEDEEAKSEMFQAQYYFEQDSLEVALLGDGNNLGFEAIARIYPQTDAGNLANFYAGVIHLKQAQYESAIDYLSDFSSSDLLAQARAYSLIGDAYVQLNEDQKAIEFYSKAISSRPTEEFTPVYLKKKATIHEKVNELDKAKASYKKIVEDFPESQFVGDAKKQLARLEGLETL